MIKCTANFKNLCYYAPTIKLIKTTKIIQICANQLLYLFRAFSSDGELWVKTSEKPSKPEPGRQQLLVSKLIIPSNGDSIFNRETRKKEKLESSHFSYIET